MNLNDQSQLYFNLDLIPSPLKFRRKKSLVHRGNEWNPDVGELQRYLADAAKNASVRCGENLAVIDSASILTSTLAISVNNRSPPLGSWLPLPA